MPGLWSNNSTESIPNVKRNIFRQEWPVGLKSSWPFFLGGILLREIQTKPKDEKRRYEGKAVRVPKSTLKALWLKSREKIISELKEAPFASQKEETSNAPANSAGEQILSSVESTTQKGADLAYRAGKKLAEKAAQTVREKNQAVEVERAVSMREELSSGQFQESDLSSANQPPVNLPSTSAQPFIKADSASSGETIQAPMGTAEKASSQKVRTDSTVPESTPRIREKPAASIKTSERTVQSTGQGIRTAKTMESTASKSAQTAKRSKQAAQNTAKNSRKVVHAVIAAGKATAAAVKNTGAAVIAGGWVSVIIILLVCSVGLFSMLTNGGKPIVPDTSWEGTGIFQWPLPQDYSITSPFGYREDPITGQISFHSGTDIAAPDATPILAAADGIVVDANAIDPWGESYGYYVKIQHDETYETLYAHCLAVFVMDGQEVQQGEVIALVGSTGNSTGNHLHFEVREDGVEVDVMEFFENKVVLFHFVPQNNYII